MLLELLQEDAGRTILYLTHRTKRSTLAGSFICGKLVQRAADDATVWVKTQIWPSLVINHLQFFFCSLLLLTIITIRFILQSRPFLRLLFTCEDPFFPLTFYMCLTSLLLLRLLFLLRFLPIFLIFTLEVLPFFVSSYEFPSLILHTHSTSL